MRGALGWLRRVEPPQILLWVPLLAALVVAAILITLHLTTPIYSALLAFIVVFDLLALCGPPRLRSGLLRAAPLTYAVTLLVGWLVALYVLPGHPATPMVRLSIVLYTTIMYIFFFVRYPPRAASLWSGAALAAFVLGTLPHSARTLGGVGAFDGAALPLTLLFAHGSLILVLRSFGLTRDQLVQAQAGMQAMYDLAHRDALTGLPNRRALEQDLDRTMQGEPGGVLLAVIDVDGLKRVNDTLGHAAGDDLLRRFALGFARNTVSAGRAYRISGDEFALLLPGAGSEEARRLVEDVTRGVRKTYPQAGASVGTARHQPGESASTWLSRADRAMYRHKKRSQEEGASPVR